MCVSFEYPDSNREDKIGKNNDFSKRKSFKKFGFQCFMMGELCFVSSVHLRQAESQIARYFDADANG